MGEIAPPDINLMCQQSLKTILITGGGGSIGSELFKQIILYNPSKVVVLDNNENNIHKLHLYIKDLEKRPVIN